MSWDTEENDEKILSLALKEIEEQIRERKVRQTDETNPIKSLYRTLKNYFGDLSKLMYRRTMDEDTYKLIYDEDKIGEKAHNDSVEYQGRMLYPYPIAYLDKMLTMKQKFVIQVLPYLLAAYYINFFSSNHFIQKPFEEAKPDKETEPDEEFKKTEETWEYRFFGKNSGADCGTEENYNRTLRNFCNKFSLENKITRFLNLKEVEDYFEGAPSLEKKNLKIYLNKGDFGKVHYRCRFYTWIYATCARACMQVAPIHQNIDYVLSTRLFYNHTLAFEVSWDEDRKIKIKDFFIPDFLQAYREELGDKDLNCCSDMGFPAEWKKEQVVTETDAVQQALLILSIEFYPYNYWQFAPMFFDDLIRNGKSKKISDLNKLCGDKND